MLKNKKAVYYICNNNWGHVSTNVWNILLDEGYLKDKAGIIFSGKEVVKFTDKNNNEFYFVPTETAICLDYDKYLPEMNKYFGDFDISGMVTWHEGPHAPSNVLTVHTLGDVNSGVFEYVKPRYMRNLMMAMNKNKEKLGLDNYTVVTEATHWSGSHNGHGDPKLLTKYHVPMMDIEVGSDENSWNDITACKVLARSLTQIFMDDEKIVHNLLCVGGIHFDPNFANAVFTQWGNNETFGVTHILANQWLVSGEYDTEDGFNRLCDAFNSIEGGVEAIVHHDKLKGCYKEVVRRLGEKYNVPVYKHQKLRKPEEMEVANTVNTHC
ncbi:MAG: D-aminoacyl-tRNA deacylase [Clostridium sp.]|nr:D-aminoacyl-tRNA deacylase [Clostridium sp.]